MTSATGAALRDVLHVLARRAAGMGILIYPVPVQGAGAARDIAAMLTLADRRREVDLLLLVRGGGSLEDLFAFNDEALARTIAALELPVVTGIGHEIDFTIADFVADLRAPTPSAAAELAAPDAQGILDGLRIASSRLSAAARRLLHRRRDLLAATERRLALRHPARRLGERMQRLDELQARALLALRRENRARADRLRRLEAELASRSPAVRLAGLAQRAAQAGSRLEPLLRTRLTLAGARLLAALRALQVASPLATLERGYAIVTRAADGAVITNAADAPPGTEIEARLASGTLAARVHARKD